MVIYRTLDEVFRTWSHVAVLRTLIDTNTGYTGNEVARAAGMHPNSAFKALSLLEGLGIVQRKVGGRDHIFSLNREHYLVQEALLKLFQVENRFLQKIITTLAAILKNNTYCAVIFGSVARREENVLSDLDICCIVNSNADGNFLRKSLSKEAVMLHKKFGIKLAPIFFTKAGFVKKKKTPLIKTILAEGILITGKHPGELIHG